MKYSIGLISALTAAMLLLASPAGAQQPAPAAKPRALSLDIKPWKGDFDQMLERRIIRVLVPYSRTLFYLDKGQERGLTAELVRDFERHINQKYAKQLGKRPLTVYLIPTTRDKLFLNLQDGLGDIAAGNLTATAERLKVVDFVVPKDGLKPVRELIITGPKSPAIISIDDLAGKTVHVRPESSYYESAVVLNQRLKKGLKQPLRIVLMPDALEDEDLLEMLNAGILEYVIVDDWKAKIWAQVLPKIKVREDLVMRAEGNTGWAIRKGSPKLEEAVLDVYNQLFKKQDVIAARIAGFQRRIKQIANNTEKAELQRFGQTIELFKKYGAKYGFDPLMLAAQGFQESALNQNARSHVGAIGVMQIMPATGRDLGVDIYQMEPNILGGAKYMDQLMTKFFPDAKFSEAERPLFAFASYNCGAGNVASMRQQAEKRGLDPNKWFNNVELVTAEKIGMETTTYVRNIYKDHAAYRMITDAQDAASKARESVERKQ